MAKKCKGFGSGHPDLYKVFAWRYWQLLATPLGEQGEGGYLGVVVPRSLLNSEGSQGFRKTIFQSTQNISIVSIINKNKWCFADVHGQFCLALLGLGKGWRGSDASISMHPICDNRQDFDALATKPAIEIKASEVTESNITATLPSFTSRQSPDVFEQLRRAPRLDYDQTVAWRIRPYQELNATTDQPLMDMETNQQPKDKWPVYKGESFNLWQADTSIYYAWAKPQPILDKLQRKRLRGAKGKNSPFSEFSKKDIARPETLSCLSPRIALRDITNSMDTQTVVCALIPPKVFCQHTAPTLLFPRGDERDQTYLLGMLCSRPLDWYARRFVGLHISHHIINAFPIPRPEADDPLRLRLIELAGTLACRDARFAAWADKIGVECGKSITEQVKKNMLAEMDAISAHLYGLSREQLTHIFATFQVTWNYREALELTMKYFEQFAE